MAITAGFVVARLRATRQEALLSILAIAAERGMPLAPAVSAFADQFRGRSQRRILNVVAAAQCRQPLPEALEKPRRAVSRDVDPDGPGRARDRAARPGRCGWSARPAPAQVAAWSAIASRLAYLLVVILIAEGISGFLAVSRHRPSSRRSSRISASACPQVTVYLIRLIAAARPVFADRDC